VFGFIRQVFKGFTLVALCVLLIPLTVFTCIVGAFVFLPLPANLPEPKSSVPSQGTRIYDVNGNEIAELRKFDLNIPIKQEDLPDIMKKATIAQEDRKFYEHGGIDPRGIGRALWQDYRNKGAVQGGSTITQQYVKLAYTNRESTITRKIREAILASQLDRQADKEEILFRYLSEVYFGEGAYGVGAAAQLYFHKDVKDLNASEAATLVGIIPSPSAWSPRADPQGAENRRKSVLRQMFDQGYLNQQQFDDAVAHPLWIESNGDAPGPVTLIKNVKRTETKYPYFVKYVEAYLIEHYGDDMTYRGGLRVQTTLDPALQDQAEKIVADKLKGTSDPLSLSLISVEPQTGFVKAMVGGRDFSKSEVNLTLSKCPAKPGEGVKVEVEPSCWKDPKTVIEAGSFGRQAASTWKAFVLAAAYEEGISPSKVYPGGSVYNIPGCNKPGTKECQIRNSDGHGGGSMTIKEAMAQSLNTIYAPLGRDVGFQDVAKMAQKLGVNDAWYSSDMHRNTGVYSLGVIEIAPLEMASAYGVFANRGIKQTTTPIVKILDTESKVIEDNSERKGERVISENVADNMNDALQGVIDHGTAAGGGNIGRPAAGKTGTGEDFGDAWFVGYTPSLSTAVWMGNRTDNKTINYKGNRSVYGGTVPLQTWAAFMKAALKDVPQTKFEEPAPITKVNTNVLQNTETTIAQITPGQVRQPKPLNAGDFDQTSGGVSVSTTSPPVTNTIR
jgi:penicillin-binding protein 1A